MTIIIYGYEILSYTTMTETEASGKEETKQFSLLELEQQLVKLRLTHGDTLLKNLKEKREELIKSTPETTKELEDKLEELKKVEEGLPAAAKDVVTERIKVLEDNLNFIKNTTLANVDSSIQKLEERVNFLKVFGI